jgi:branched-chain amino acid transport system ATP-binding protein|tara:strand:+ start:116 stop:751 length:636 start_codon:yes stop_codon:yes gene_type:complete
MLKLEQITVQYGALMALNAVGLCIAEGTISVIEGHHGAGKSSLLKAIIGAVPSKGKVWLDQHLITRRTPARLLQAGVVLVPEGRQLFGRLSTRENLQFGLHVAGNRGSIETALEYFPQLLPLLDKPAYVLSGGQAQMLAIARAMLAKPRYLLADEPLMGLSDGPREQVWQVLVDLRNRGVGVLVTGEHMVLTGTVIEQHKIISNGNLESGE